MMAGGTGHHHHRLWIIQVVLRVRLRVRLGLGFSPSHESDHHDIRVSAAAPAASYEKNDLMPYPELSRDIPGIPPRGRDNTNWLLSRDILGIHNLQNLHWDVPQ